MEAPVTGVVYNTGEHKNKAIQSNTDAFEISWHGFLDLDTGINYYSVALYEISDIPVLKQNFTNVSGQTRLKLTGLNLTHNAAYQGVVKAVDAVGHESDLVFTERQLIDATSPETFTCDDETIIFNRGQNISRNKTIVFTASFTLSSRYTVSGKVTSAWKSPHLRFLIDQRIGETLHLQSTHDGYFNFHYSFFSDFDGRHDVKFETEDTKSVHVEVFLSECMPVLFEDRFDAIRLTQISANLLKASVKAVDPESKIKQVR